MKKGLKVRHHFQFWRSNYNFSSDPRKIMWMISSRLSSGRLMEVPARQMMEEIISRSMEIEMMHLTMGTLH